MLVLGLDPSLTNFGWALHDTQAEPKFRCVRRGRFQTSAKDLYISRYMEMRERLQALIQETNPDKMGIEFPVFDNLYSEGMYGLFLFVSEAIHAEKKDVVFWSPLQAKAHAREFLGRPKNWTMMKPDMVEAAKVDTASTATWNHNEADAYLIAKLSGRFWQFMAGEIGRENLTDVERKYFTEVQTFQRGKRAGETVMKGVSYRENERFFLWSNTHGESSSTRKDIEASTCPRGNEEDPQDG